MVAPSTHKDALRASKVGLTGRLGWSFTLFLQMDFRIHRLHFIFIVIPKKHFSSFIGCRRMGKEQDEIIRTLPLLVGYGTLLSRPSLASTVGPGAEGKELIPVIVQGFRRLFNLRPGHYEPSYHLTHEPAELGALNVQKVEGARFNGLAFSVSDGELAALDKRERYYSRIEAPVRSFPDGLPLGMAFFYSAGADSPWVIEDPGMLRPHWRDIVLARQGAYEVGPGFGEMFDSTTYLAGGRTLAINEYRNHLPPVEED